MYTHYFIRIVNDILYTTDIDECLSDPCDVNAICINTAGSYICDCNIGYSGTGYICTGLYMHTHTTLCT